MSSGYEDGFRPEVILILGPVEVSLLERKNLLAVLQMSCGYIEDESDHEVSRRLQEKLLLARLAEEGRLPVEYKEAVSSVLFEPIPASWLENYQYDSFLENLEKLIKYIRRKHKIAGVFIYMAAIDKSMEKTMDKIAHSGKKIVRELYGYLKKDVILIYQKVGDMKIFMTLWGVDENGRDITPEKTNIFFALK